jgi:hypothetical protein
MLRVVKMDRSVEECVPVGVLMGGAVTDLESQPRITALQQGLEKLGWKVGRNVRIDYRWTMADLDRTRTGAEELLRLSPDVLLVAPPTLRERRHRLRALHFEGEIGPIEKSTPVTVAIWPCPALF